MYFQFILSILLVCASYNTFCQNTFEFTYIHENDHIPSTLIEATNGNIFVAYNDKDENNANILKISSSGQLVDSLTLNNPDGKCEFKELLKINDETFVCFGIYPIDTNYQLWFCKFNLELNVISDIKIEVDENIWSYYMASVINNEGNILLTTIYEKEELNTDVCIFEISIEGELIQEKYFQTLSSGVVLCQDVFQIPNSNDYYIFTNTFYTKFTGQVVRIDSVFNVLEISPQPWLANDLHSAKITSDSTFMVSSKEDVDTKGYKVLGLAKMDMDANTLDTIHLGQEYIDSWAGFHSNIDFIDAENIFYGGFSNVDLFNPFYSTMPSWLILNKVDFDLNLKWQKYYGGDACYNLSSILATQDGGCVMAGTRYDYQTQNMERDVYILKVDEDGLITWTHNFPENSKAVVVYPNPGMDHLVVKPQTDNLTFELYNSSGIKVLTNKLKQIGSLINTASLKTGIYIYKINNESGKTMETGKWIRK